MIGLVEVSQDTLFLLFVTERQFHKSYRPKHCQKFPFIPMLKFQHRTDTQIWGSLKIPMLKFEHRSFLKKCLTFSLSRILERWRNSAIVIVKKTLTFSFNKDRIPTT